MIETYKILSGKYDTNVVGYQLWKHLASKQPGVMIWEFSKLVLIWLAQVLLCGPPP